MDCSCVRISNSNYPYTYRVAIHGQTGANMCTKGS